MNDLFVDRLGNVTIAAGVARLDFLRVESIDNEKKQMTLKPSIRVAMPLDGLVQTIQMLEQIKAQLVAQASQQGAPQAQLQPTAPTPANPDVLEAKPARK